jgi:hypothetical protein
VRVRAAPPGADADAVSGAIIRLKGSIVNGEICNDVSDGRQFRRLKVFRSGDHWIIPNFRVPSLIARDEIDYRLLVSSAQFRADIT